MKLKLRAQVAQHSAILGVLLLVNVLIFAPVYWGPSGPPKRFLIMAAGAVFCFLVSIIIADEIVSPLKCLCVGLWLGCLINVYNFISSVGLSKITLFWDLPQWLFLSGSFFSISAMFLLKKKFPTDAFDYDSTKTVHKEHV